MENLEKKILDMIIERVDVEEQMLVNVDYDAPLFSSYADGNEGLQLDSVDSLELVVGVNEIFNIKMEDEDMSAFRSISSLADYIREKKNID